MKKTKTAAFLFAVFFVLALAACSPGGKISDNSKNPAELDAEDAARPYYDILGARDFYGDTFTVLDSNPIPHLFMNFPEEGEINGEPINDALYLRDSFIEEKYGVNIEYIKITNGNGRAVLEKSVRAGEDKYDLIVSPLIGPALDSLSTGNVLSNLIDAPYLSLQSPWWSKMIYDNMQFNDRLYYMGGDIFVTSYSLAPAAMVFNKKLVQDHGIKENLYELVFEGKWTLDVVARLVKDTDMDLNQDGKMLIGDDFYGFVCLRDRTNTLLWLAGLGVKFSTVEEDMIKVELTSPENLDKIDKLAGIMTPIEYGGLAGYGIDRPFKENRAIFVSHALEMPRMYLRDMEDDYGILPMPKYDEKQESYISALNPWVSGFVAIPMNADVDKSAFLMEAMGYAGYEMLRPAVYDITLKAKGARDEESERIIDIILETAYLDINYIYNFGGTCDILNDTIMNKKPLVSAYEKKETAMQKEIAKFIEAMSQND